jgi:hypothetical protein
MPLESHIVRPNTSSVFLWLIVSHLIVASGSVSCLGQEIVRLRYSSNAECSKQIIQNYKFSLVLDSMEIPIAQSGDSILYKPSLLESQFQEIEGKEYVVIRLSNGRNCFITKFPNVFEKNDSDEDTKALYITFFVNNRPNITSCASWWVDLFHSNALRMRYTDRDDGKAHIPHLLKCSQYDKHGGKYEDYILSE